MGISKPPTLVSFIPVLFLIITTCEKPTEPDIRPDETEPLPSAVTVLKQDTVYKNHIRIKWTRSKEVPTYKVLVAYDSLITDHVYSQTTYETTAIFSGLGNSGNPSDDGQGWKYYVEVIIADSIASSVEMYQTSRAVKRIYIPYDMDNLAAAVGSADGDTVFVPEGEHLLGKNTVRNSVTIVGVGDPEKTILRNHPDYNTALLHGSSYSPDISLWNLTVGPATAGIFAGNSQARANVFATNVIFRNLEQVAVMQTSQLESSFRNCIFYSIEDRVFDVYENVLIENCVFANNNGVLQINPSQGHNSGIVIRNSIFYDNYGDNIVFENFGYEPNELPTIEYSDISLDKVSGYQGTLSGVGLIDADPLWVDPDNKDFHLQSSSPCVDAGNPDTEFNDLDSSRNDMGAYGGPFGSWEAKP